MGSMLVNEQLKQKMAEIENELHYFGYSIQFHVVFKGLILFSDFVLIVFSYILKNKMERDC
jgi:hypothetical protein